MKIFKLILLTLSILTVYEVWSNPIEETSEESTNILFWSSKQKEKGFNRIDEFIPSLPIKKGKYTYHLENKFIDLSNVSYDLYGKSYSIKDYFLKLRVAGLLVVHKGNIVYEEYGLDNDENSRWISFSVAKSVTSMLLGAAIQDGFIGSVEDPITKYLPQLVGSSYENVSIKNLLQMSSGVDWDENYSDPESDVSIAAGFNSTTLFNYLSKLPINSKPGKLFNYNTGETNLVGDLVRSAINNNLSYYLEQKIWQPFGMESDGSWSLDGNHLLELGGCCINATLRDYARIGLFAMHDGRLNDGTRVLPEGWMEESTAPSKGYKGYGYQWWLETGELGSFSALGIFGQMIWINPTTETVIVMHSAWPFASTQELSIHQFMLTKAINDFLKKIPKVKNE